MSHSVSSVHFSSYFDNAVHLSDNSQKQTFVAYTLMGVSLVMFLRVIICHVMYSSLVIRCMYRRRNGGGGGEELSPNFLWRVHIYIYHLFPPPPSFRATAHTSIRVNYDCHEVVVAS